MTDALTGALPVGEAGTSQDRDFMAQAMVQARLADEAGEVPVGAIVVDAQGQVIGVGRNRVITDSDPTAHAEIVALRAASHACGNYRLPGARVYVTLEPCAMCMGAMIHARLALVVYGAHDPKTGACGGSVDLRQAPFNHQTTVVGGVLADDCGDLLRQFFRRRRTKDIQT